LAIPCFVGPFKWHILDQSLKLAVRKQLIIGDH